MKIRIEHETAITACFGQPGTAPRFAGAGRQGEVALDLRLEPQRLPHWCWAALASSVGRFYGTGEWPQEEVAGRVLGRDCSRWADDPGIRAGADILQKLVPALSAVGCYSHWSLGKPCFSRVQFEINAGRPLCLRLEWHRGGAHFVMIRGYQPEGESLLVADPLHGPAIIAYADFPRRYRHPGGEGAVWTETYWTGAPPGPPRFPLPNP